MLEAAGTGVRPLTTTGIVDAAIEHLRDDPVLFYGIAAPIVLPLAAVGLYFVDLTTDYRGEPAGYTPRVQVAAALLALLVHLRFVAHGALAWALERKLRGAEVGAGQAWWAALKRSLPLGLAGVAFWAGLWAGLFFLAIPSLVAFSLLVLAPAVAVIEDRGAFGTLLRACELGWRDTARALLVAFVLALGTGVVALGIGGGFQGLLELARSVAFVDTTWLEAVAVWSNKLFVVAVAGGTLLLVEPVQVLAFALLYVDRRVRTEGFDLRRKVELILLAEKERRESAEAAAAIVLDSPAGESGRFPQEVGA